MLVKVSAGLSENACLLARQTPGSSQIWNNIQFVINQQVDQCDWWIVCHAGGLIEEEHALCDPNHLVFISMEPPDWGRPDHFFSQFSHLISCDTKIRHPNLLLRNGLSWWAGLNVSFNAGHEISASYTQDYDDFSRLSPPSKLDRVSVITSSNSAFPGHKKRLAFLDRLRSHPISQFIDYYGGASSPVQDKFNALIGYKYHLALENSSVPHYWTEKIADPLLAWTLPIYYGCPNMDEYLPSNSFVSVDIDDFEATIDLISSIIQSDGYSDSLPALAQARDLVLNKYNIFQLMADICVEPASQLAICTLKPYDYYAKRSSRIDRRLLRKLSSSVEKFFCS
jgi:hypothetical protein